MIVFLLSSIHFSDIPIQNPAFTIASILLALVLPLRKNRYQEQH